MWQAPARMTQRSFQSKVRFGFGSTLASIVLVASVSCGGQQAAPSAPEPQPAPAPAPPPAPAPQPTSTEAAAAPAARAPASAPAAEPQRAGQASIFVMHFLKDFEGFKKFFEKGAPDRAKAGVKGYLLTKLDDGRIVIHLFADDVATVEAALSSPDMQKYLDRKGAPESSLLLLMKDVSVKLPATPPTGTTYSLYVRLNVEDFAALERGFGERSALFAEHGVIGQGLHRSTSAEGVAILHFVGTAKDKLAALAKRKEFTEMITAAKNKLEVKPVIGVDVLRDRPQ